MRNNKIVVLFYCLIVVLLVLVEFQPVTIVYAQEATDSGSLATSSGQMTIGQVSPVSLPQDPQSQAAFLGVNQLGSNPTPSASVAQSAVVSALPKKSYKANEQVELTVGNSTTNGVQVEIIDSYGLNSTSKFVIQKFQSSTNTIIDVTAPQSRFKPGKYTIKITDQNGGTTSQDFTWGVLAINTNKATYTPGETAHIAMAVLDDLGNMVCDAKVILDIKNQIANIDETLSTDDGSITVNPQCTSHAFSLTPDYAATFSATMTGTYTMNLSATTSSGSYSITDSFTVASSVAFDVERVSATRLYPPLAYPETMNITANQDFSGTITDYVPATFDISEATAPGVTSYTDVKTVYPNSLDTESLFGVASLQLALPFTGTHAVTQGFGEQLTDPLEKQQYAFYHVLGHDGIDFGMPIGTSVLSTDDGVVVQATQNGDYGTTIVIRHSWGQSYYGHLSIMEVTVGQHVIKGQEIAKSGNTGIESAAHLHFSIKPKNPQMENGFFGKVDPAPFLPLNQSDQGVWSVNTALGNQPLKVVEWQVNLKKGDNISLGYQFKAPRVSPQFYTLGPLHFIDNDGNVVFSEARLWQLAVDAVFPATSYLSNTASSKITSTTSWQIVTSVPASGNTTTSITDASNKVAGYTQWLPGTTDSTKAGSAPTTPDGKGFLYDTPLDSTIPTGNWTFTAQTSIGTAITSGAMHVSVCAWKVTVSGGAITGSTQISTCTDSATNIYTPTGAINSTVTFSSVAAQSFTSSQYLYLEYWAHNAGSGGGSAKSGTITFQTNAGVNNDIVLSGGASSNLAPSAPTQTLPANSQTGVSLTPTFTMNTTDPETDNLGYRVVIYTSAACSGGTTYDMATSSTGWSGQNATCTNSPTSCYTSGTTATFTLPTANALVGLTQYWWQAGAKDPDGSGSFTNSSTCNTFTTQAPPPTLDQLLRHGEYFYNGTAEPFTF